MRNVVPRQGTETVYQTRFNLSEQLLRNVVPRQGTETEPQSYWTARFLIEKCSSPTGDGNVDLFNDYLDEAN